MLIIGLTGSIGMGKSTAAAQFRRRGIAVFDADAEVHRLYAGPAAAIIEQMFPGTTSEGVVVRPRLAAALKSDDAAFKRLEAVVHPMVRAAQRAFLAEAAATGAAMAVLEIPLLLETGGDANVDVVVVVSARPEQQRERVLARPGMTPERADQIISRQMPDAEKCRRADFVVDTSGSIAETEAQVDRIIDECRGRAGTALERRWC